MVSSADLVAGAAPIRKLAPVALLVNALDLSTSIPSAYNTEVPDRPLALLVVQLALLVPLAALARRRAPPLWAALTRAPVPPVARVVLGGVLALQLVFMAFKVERYPLTNVGMFTYRIEPFPAVTRLPDQLVRARGEQLQVLSLRRTGDPCFTDPFWTDHQLSLLLIKHPDHPVVRRYLQGRFAEVGMELPEPRPIWVRWDAEGTHVSLQPPERSP